MTEPLLGAADFRQFRKKSADWFLGAAGETIRDYCGWHIYPILSVTDVWARIGNKGIVMLSTLNLVSVERLSWCGTDMPSSGYEVHEEGWIQQVAQSFGSPAYRGMRNAWVTVDFTHGYEELPTAVAEVGFELTARAMEKPAGVVKAMTRGPTQLEFNEFGVVLSDDQKNRLGPYTLTRL
jgi:hypothetical protein